MSPVPIRDTAASMDLTARFFRTTTVVASPTDDTETIVSSLTITGDIAAIAGIIVVGFAAFTVGTNGVSAAARIRRTNAAGTAIVSSGLVTATAANLTERTIVGFDTGPTLPAQVYVMTLTVTSASAGSTVSAATLLAIVT
jgi:hypothetical protein